MTSNHWAKKLMRVAAMSLVALLIGFGIRTIILNPEVIRGDYELPAFTVASIEKYYPDGDGVEKFTHTYVDAVRANGARVNVMEQQRNEIPSRRGYVLNKRRIGDPDTGEHIVVYPAVKAVSTMPLVERQTAFLKTRFNCESEQEGIELDTNPEPSTILGFRVIRQIRRVSDGADSITIDSLIAPDLNCFTLRLTSRHKLPEWPTERVIRTKEAVSVVVGEPDPELFEVDPTYREMSPADAMEEWTSTLEPGTIRNFGAGLERATERYEQLRTP